MFRTCATTSLAFARASEPLIFVSVKALGKFHVESPYARHTGSSGPPQAAERKESHDLAECPL